MINQNLEWHRFTKRNMPQPERQILVCRDYGHDPFFVIVSVIGEDMLSYNKYDGIHEFEIESRDRWTYIPYPEGAVDES